MVVCHCNVVNDREIREQILAGALSLDEIAERCTAGTRCGNCVPMLEAMIAESGVTIRPLTAA